MDAIDNKKLNIAFVGLGDRGRTAVRMMAEMPDVRVAALCDTVEANVTTARAALVGQTFCAAGTDAYKLACGRPDVDLVYVCTDWNSHATIALEALRAGKHVAVEVPAALTIGDLEQLVQTARAAGRRCFMLENCCFDRQVQDAVAAIRRGEIGEMVHAEGTYYHELDDRWTGWRLEINRQLAGDLYPTHEIGPICMALGIGQDDEFQTLVSMDSAAIAGPRVYKRALRKEAEDFAAGDHTTTLIRTRRGRTILLKHDVMTRQDYDRQLTFIGIEGRIVLTDEGRPSHEAMTRAMNRHLVEALMNGGELLVSEADMARWCAIVPLSLQSIKKGYAPVAFPDFNF